MSIHKSLNLGGGITSERSVFTRRERIERLIERGDFEEGANPLGLPKVRTRFKVVTRRQAKAMAAAEAAREAAAAAAAAAEAASAEEEEA
jgi:small basic protein (TIGR04137 family)